MRFTTALPIMLIAIVCSVKASNAFTSSSSAKVASKTILQSTATATSTVKTSTVADFANEEALLKQSTFPIQPEQLIQRAKDVLISPIRLGIQDNGECLADNFEFVAAVVGPINKTQYLNALGSFKLEDGFDINPQFYGFTVDPYQPNRVWFFNRVQAIHTGNFMGAEPTGKEIVYPPQVHHIDFNEQGKLIEYGFYTSDRRQGNTGGLGGAFGFMYAVGKPLPIPECQPYKPSIQFRLLNLLGPFLQKLRGGN